MNNVSYFLMRVNNDFFYILDIKTKFFKVFISKEVVL